MILTFWAAFLSFFQDTTDSLKSLLSTNTVQEISVQSDRTNKPPVVTNQNTLQTVSRTTGVARKASYLGRIREAERLIEHEYYTEAGVELSLAIEEKPTVLKPFLLLGDIYIRTRDTERLKKLIAELKRTFPDRVEVSILEARLRILNDDFQGVQRLISALPDPLPPRLRLYEALLLALQNNHTQARVILEALQDLSVEPYALKVGNGGIEESTLQMDVVSPDVAAVVDALLQQYEAFDLLTDGKNAHLFALLGKELGVLDETVFIRAFSDIAVQEDASYIDAWILRGYSYFLEKSFDLALHDFYQAYRLDPIRPQTHYFLALTLTELNRNKEAISFFEKALEHDFEFSDDVDWKLVELFVKEERYDRVPDLYRRLLTPDTEESKISRAFHVLIDKADYPDEALILAESFIIENMDNVFLLNMYAWALIANDQFERAETILEQADDLIPEHPQTHLNFGLLFETQNDIADAKDYYKKSYEYGKSSPEFISLANFAASKYNDLVEK